MLNKRSFEKHKHSLMFGVCMNQFIKLRIKFNAANYLSALRFIWGQLYKTEMCTLHPPDEPCSTLRSPCPNHSRNLQQRHGSSFPLYCTPCSCTVLLFYGDACPKIHAGLTLSFHIQRNFCCPLEMGGKWGPRRVEGVGDLKKSRLRPFGDPN